MAAERERSATPLTVGRYVLGEPIASGGMGTVHLGRIVGASGFSRVVAVKRLFPGFSGDPALRAMLLDEARFASRVRHPNVVPILDVVEEERDLFVVMEYVHGLSIAELTDGAPGAQIPIDVALAIVEGVLLGLHAAHEARAEDGTPLGIVHRDVSPQNVLVGGDGVARLIDFGIAKAATRLQATEPGRLKGKAAYMAPEQLMQEPVTRHADVFAASVVLWEVLTRCSLFTFELGERVRRLDEPPPPPSRHRPEVDRALDAIVLRGLARDPAARFATAEAMAHELRRGREVASPVEVARWITRIAADQLEVAEERVRLFERAIPASPDASGGAPAFTAVAATPDLSSLGTGRTRRGRTWLAALAALGVVAAGALALMRGQDAARRPDSPPLSATAVITSEPAPPIAPIAPPEAPQPVPPPFAAPSASTAPAPKSLAAHAPSGHPHSGAKPKCDPPYTLDPDGFKHYDPRCF